MIFSQMVGSTSAGRADEPQDDDEHPPCRGLGAAKRLSREMICEDMALSGRNEVVRCSASDVPE